MPSQKQRRCEKALRDAALRGADAKNEESHAEALKKAAAKEREEAQQDAEAKPKPRTGGAFAGDTPRPMPPTRRRPPAPPPPRPASQQRAILRTNRQRTEELLQDARDDEPTPTAVEEVVVDVAAHLAPQRTYLPPSTPWLGEDGLRWCATFDGPDGAVTSRILLCVICGWGRPNAGADKPFNNGYGFGEGMSAQGQPIPVTQPTFVCRRCQKSKDDGSRPYAAGGARRIAQQMDYKPPPIEVTKEQKDAATLYERAREDGNNEELQYALTVTSRATAAAEREVRRNQDQMILGSGAVRVLDACTLEAVEVANHGRPVGCRAELAAFGRAAKALPLPLHFVAMMTLLENVPLRDRGVVENVIRLFGTLVVPILKRESHWSRGRLESERAAEILEEPLLTLRARFAEQRRGVKSVDEALDEFRDETRQAFTDARKFKRDVEAKLRTREANVLANKVDLRVTARWPIPRYRVKLVEDKLQDELLLVPRSFELSAQYKRLTHQNLRAVFLHAKMPSDAPDVVGYLASPIRCCGRSFEYMYHKGVNAVVTFFSPQPNDADTALHSVAHLISSTGDYIGVPDSKVAARISLWATSTTPIKTLDRGQICVIPDIVHDGHNFSDGPGTMSQGLADIISKEMGQDVTGVQIRFGSCKGMLQIDPALKGVLLCLRDSMIKARSTHRRLEVKAVAKIKTSGNMLFLQAIIVLANMLGSDATLIHRLMDRFIEKTLLLRKEDVDGHGGGYDGSATPEQLDKLVDVLKTQHYLPETFGVVDTEGDDARRRALLELSWRSPLNCDGTDPDLNVYKAIGSALTEARRRLCIGVDGLLLGQVVCDESGQLMPGQVLVGNGKVTGRVIILRSPCCHPGDAQIFEAVPGRREWRHLKDLIVFSVKGCRPAMDMLSGGDGDGDEVYVIAGTDPLLQQVVAFAKAMPPATYATPSDLDDATLQAAAAAKAARMAEVAFSPMPGAPPPPREGMLSELRMYVDGGKLVALSARGWLRAVDRFGVDSPEAKAFARIHEMALDTNKTGAGDELRKKYEQAMKCFGRSRDLPSWIPGRADGKIVPGRNTLLQGLAHGLDVAKAAVEKRLMQLRFDEDHPVARAADGKLMQRVKARSRAEEPATAKGLERESRGMARAAARSVTPRTSSSGPAGDMSRVLDDLAAAKRKADEFSRGLRDRCSLVLSRPVRKEFHEYLDGDPRFANIKHVLHGEEPKRLVLCFKEERPRTEFSDWLALLADDAGDDDADSFRTQLCRAVAFADAAEMSSKPLTLVFKDAKHGRIHDFYDSYYRHVQHRTISGARIKFSIKWSLDAVPGTARDDGRATDATADTSAATRMPADATVNAHAGCIESQVRGVGGAAAADEAAALQRALDETKACADESAAAEAAERDSALKIVSTIEAQDEADAVHVGKELSRRADAVARQQEAEELARVKALSAREAYGHEERKGGDSDCDYEKEEGRPRRQRCYRPGPPRGPSTAELVARRARHRL